MKAKKYWILISLIVTVCGIGVIDVTVNQKAIGKPVQDANVADERANPTGSDRENKQLREQVRNLEDTIKKLEEKVEKDKIRTGWGTMPGLRGSLVGLPAIGVNIEDLSLTAIRYGLTKQNIQKIVESKLTKNNIKPFDFSNLSGLSHEKTLLLAAINDKPQLKIEIVCSELNYGLYMGYIKVSMSQFWTTEKDDSRPDIVEKVKRQSKYIYGGAVSAPPEILEEVEKLITELKNPIKSYNHITTWDRQCMIILGRLNNFAEDERNALEELIDEFINDYLAANP
jgi:hypothetical protein